MPFYRFLSAFSLIKTPLVSARHHRHLLKEFVMRDVKGRFAGSMGGVLWTLINPLVNIVIYLFLFSLVLRIRVTPQETGTDSFAIFFLTGMFPWLIFSEGLFRAIGCLVDNANLITRVVFSVELLPLATVIAASVVNGIGMLLFMVCLIPMGFFHWTWLLVVFLLPVQVMFTWGLGSILAALSVFIRDVRELVGIVLLLWFYATPIIYPVSMVPAGLRPFMAINPMGIFIDVYRNIILRHELNFLQMGAILAIGLASYCMGSWFFMRAKPAFGDVL